MAMRALWRNRRGIGVAMLFAGVLGAGAVLGWLARSTVGDGEEVTVTVDRPVSAVDVVRDASLGAPNVLGLDEATARQALFDAGLVDDEVEIVEVPAAGRAGRVVSQDPAPGVRVDKVIQIGVSDRADVPDLLGATETEATRALDELGARIVVRAQYRDNVDEGTVLALDPEPGERLPVEVAVTVASPPSSVFLAGLDPLESDCGGDDAQIGGDPYPSSVLCSADRDGAVADYLLNGRVARIEATLGQIDESEQNASVRYVIVADGTPVVDETIRFGESKEVAADLAGVLRVQILVTFPGGDDCCADVTAALGSARFVGAPDAIDALIAGSAS